MGLHKRVTTSYIPTRLRAWLPPLLLILAAGALLAGGDTAREVLRYERARIGDGELWRLITGHLAHLGGSHFLLNGAGLALVWYLVGDALRTSGWAAVAIASLIAMDAGFWLLNPELAWYVGLSGLLHGILAAGLVMRIGSLRPELIALAILLAGKIAWEQFAGPLPGSEAGSGGPVVVDAPPYGAIGGALAAVVIRVRTPPTI